MTHCHVILQVMCLKAVTSSFICGLHYTYQTKDDICLVGTCAPAMVLPYRLLRLNPCLTTGCLAEPHGMARVLADLITCSTSLMSGRCWI